MLKAYERIGSLQAFVFSLLLFALAIGTTIKLVYQTERGFSFFIILFGLELGLFISEKIIKDVGEPLINELNQILLARDNTIKQLNRTVDKLAEDLDNLEHWKDSRQEAIAKFQILEFQLSQAQDTNHKLQWQLEQSQSDSERYYSEGYQSGYQHRSSEFDGESERLTLELENMRLKLERYERHDKIESKILPLDSVIIEKLPLIICGEQRSGKALATQFSMGIYSEGNPYLAFCLDVSEGNDTDGTWARNGVPSTNNPQVFLEFLRVINSNLGNRVLNNDSENFSKQPILFVIIDELLTCIHSLERAEKQEFETIFTKLHTQGKKRGIYLIVCSQSHQVQNMKSGSITFLNGGLLRNFSMILLNKCMDKALDFEESFRTTHKDYLTHISGKYRAVFGNIGEFQPIQHPSHHGNKIGNSKPRILPEKCNLATIPQWLKAVVAPMVGNGEIPVGSGGVVKSMPQSKVLPCLESTLFVPQSNRGLEQLYGEFSGVVNRNEFDSLVNCITNSLNQEKSILQVFNIKKSGKNPRYRQLAQVYTTIKGAI